MGYQIKWKPSPFKYLNKLEKKDKERIFDKLDEVEKDPFRYLEHFEGDYYKLRIGDFRLLIDVIFEGGILMIEVLDKRGRIYFFLA